MEILFSAITTDLVTSLGGLTILVTVIVEVLKKILPKDLPTQFLTFCVSLLVCLLAVVFMGEITTINIISGLLNGFFVAYISMFGFDTFKSLVNRFKDGNDG